MVKSRKAAKTAAKKSRSKGSSLKTVRQPGVAMRGNVLEAVQESLKQPPRGSALARAIEHKAMVLGLTQREVSSILGVSEPYYGLLISGGRWFGNTSEDKLKKVADFLDIPLMSVYMLAEMVYPEDFFRTSSLEHQLAKTFEAMLKDNRFITMMPPQSEWESTSLRVRLLCALLYCDSSGKDLMEKFRMIAIKNPDVVL